MVKKAPLTDEILFALAKLVDDAQQTTREPSHSEIEYQITRFKLEQGDPHFQKHSVGKAKRVRSILNWAMENNLDAGEKFVGSFIALLRALGGFRESSKNYVGKEAIMNAQAAFKSEGWELSSDGDLRPIVLDNLSELEQEEALRAYITRAKKGVEDAALLAGTGKDLLEAVCGFILTKLWGHYPTTSNFPTLLGQTFTSLNLVYDKSKIDPSSRRSQQRFEASLYELGCSINNLRNKEGTGHGRPFLTTITDSEAKAAIESMGMISAFLMNKWKNY
ncbi:abortive infection family protein [Bacillus sp. ISL-37]|uniref:abortive infection family protein n=1 Tax=Bacillus sp. ISL-37 TaxID=2819123 RepID=UPI001BE5F2BA|nr:abortive infection family protein [Bacillus sp. ISL-37]MBT2684897.1 abortive infection family protein [Bacillus sp. ISL-37]